MRTLSAWELLQVWEDGVPFSPMGRSLHLLGAACSVADMDSIAELSIGERDARLLLLREWLFGTKLFNRINCPRCGEPAEWAIQTSDIRLQEPRADAMASVFELSRGELRLQFRLPNSHDLIRAASGELSDPRRLLAGCVLTVNGEEKDLAPADLPDEMWEALEMQMEEQDPQADIRMMIGCPACGHQWETHFDIGVYLWAEVENWAHRILREVYLLARAFGWSEYDILTMTPKRRQLYLEMLS
ncbi:T4 family baseplate hub assembly chaperone [Puia dinghuensis]|uniref:Phage baseplate protein n=1 Tax=Puia dinghuensis TaxID=1792502 RepID=A0A8J2XRE4_9BACT|nr:phage baseplate protein [Puia dinghuensis]GGA88721.1 hypothetical protein GCM10011511_09930 [Puia dinghuensis]